MLLKERNRFFKDLFYTIGFDIECIDIYNVKRTEGKIKWSFIKLFRYAVDAIVSYSNVLLIISSIAGVLLCLLSIIFLIVIITRFLLFGVPVPGSPSLVSIILFLSGLQFLFIGILVIYMSKNYMEPKKDLFLLQTRVIFDKKFFCF